MVDFVLIDNYLEFHEAIPIRCSAVYICYDTTSNWILSNTETSLLKVFDDGSTIPMYELSVTPTGVTKRKKRNEWIKIQDWFERQNKQDQAAIQE